LLISTFSTYYTFKSYNDNQEMLLLKQNLKELQKMNDNLINILKYNSSDSKTDS